jgi:ribosomal protein S18 acetylase RimI-like enzyme
MIRAFAWNRGHRFAYDSNNHELQPTTETPSPPNRWEEAAATLDYSLGKEHLTAAWNNASSTGQHEGGVEHWMAFLWEENRLAGLLVARIVFDDMEIDYVATFPSFRRKGGGALLMRIAESIAKKGAAKRILLEVATQNRAAINLYASLSFQRIGLRKWYYKDGDDALVLAKSFCSSR